MALGIGIARSRNDKVLDVWYPYVTTDAHEIERVSPFLGSLDNRASLAALCKETGDSFLEKLVTCFARKEERYHEMSIVTFDTDTMSDVSSTQDAYLRLHLLSYGLVKPHEMNMDGIFTHLPNNTWVEGVGPVLAEDVDQLRLQARLQDRELVVTHVDKFPRLVNYIIPKGVRIAHGDMLRLGAFAGEGTVFMHQGFANFNTYVGKGCMIEGRVSAGVIIGDHTDIGGGASIMGTLSGGGKEIIRIGSGVLIGANAGTGISLGDLSVIESGLYVTGGQKITVDATRGDSAFIETLQELEYPITGVVKGSTLSGIPYTTFMRNSQSGAVTAYVGVANKAKMNTVLHRND